MIEAVAERVRWRPEEIPAEWRADLLRIPGYDAIATAGESLFDEELAQTALDFFPECLTHVEGELAGQPFSLEPWQKAIVANIFGWVRLDRYGRWVRRYKEVFILIARKNGKSPLAAGIAILAFFLDEMKGKQCYLAAADREQASVVFRHCKGMVENTDVLSSRCKIYGGGGSNFQNRSIVQEDENSFLRVISADADSKHGGNTHLAVIDELHVQPNRDLVDVLTTSTASVNVPQTLVVYLTTSDYERVSICNEKHDIARKVRDGKVSDPAFLPVIYEILPDEDWTDPKIWPKANPNIGVSVSEEYLERECQKAIDTIALQDSFRRFHLNIRTQASNPGIAIEKWDACAALVEHPGEWRSRRMTDLCGQSCAGGLDLGSISDLTALALLFGNDIEGYDLLPFFWCPRMSAEKRSRDHGVPYLAWARAGFLTLTEGNETDYQAVRSDVMALSRQFRIKGIYADRLFQGAQLCQDLIRDGLNVVEMGQGYVSMAAPTRQFIELIGKGKMRHGANPVLRWMASHVAKEEKDQQTLKFSRERSAEKIDGLIASVMGLQASISIPEEVAFYTPGSMS